jgi:hypothetical protein
MIFPYDEKETSHIMINVAKLQFFSLFVFNSEINFCVASHLINVVQISLAFEVKLDQNKQDLVEVSKNDRSFGI